MFPNGDMVLSRKYIFFCRKFNILPILISIKVMIWSSTKTHLSALTSSIGFLFVNENIFYRILSKSKYMIQRPQN